MPKTPKPPEMPRKGGSFVRDVDGKLTQTDGPAVAAKAKPGKPSKPAPDVKKEES